MGVFQHSFVHRFTLNNGGAKQDAPTVRRHAIVTRLAPSGIHSRFLATTHLSSVLCIFHGALLCFVLSASHVAAQPSHFDEAVVFGSDQNYPPFEFLNERNEPDGFNIDLMKAIAERRGFKVQFKLGPWPQISKEFLENKTVDVTDMFYSAERDSFLDFAVPYTVVYQELLVRKNTPGISGIEDIGGKELVIQGSTLALARVTREYPGARIIPVASEPEAIRLLAEGKYDCALVSQITANMILREDHYPNITKVGSLVMPTEYGLVVRAGNAALLSELNYGMALLKEDGTFSELEKRWLVQEAPPLMKYLIALSVVLAIAGFVLLWNVRLKQQVRRKRQEAAEASRRFSDTLEAMVDGFISLNKQWQITYINQSAAQIFNRQPEELIRSNVWTISGEFTQATRERYTRALQAHGPITFEHLSPGTDTWFEHRVVPSREGISVFLQDITERKSAEEELQRRLHYITILHRSGMLLAEQPSVSDVAHQVLLSLHELFGWQRGSVWKANHAEGTMQLLAHDSMGLDGEDLQEELERVRGMVIRIGDGITGWVAQHGVPLRIPDVRRDSRYLDADQHIRSELCVPLKVRGKVLGALNVESTIPDAFSDNDEMLLTTLANQAAVALENAALVEDLRRELHERQMTELALRRSEERYRKLTENFPNGIVTTYDTDLRVTYMAGSDMRNRNVTQEQFLNKLVYEIAPPESVEIAVPFFRRAFAGEIVSFEADYYDGMTYHVSIAPLFSADGTINEILVAAQNITENRRTEKMAANALHLTRTILESAPAGITTYKATGEVLFANEACASIFGCDVDELRKQNFRSQKQWEVSGMLRHANLALLEWRELEFETDITTPAGKHIALACRFQPFYFGNDPHLLCLFTDITERKKNVLDLKASAERLHRLSGYLQNVREEERKRISREIHDELGQQLTAIKIEAALLRKLSTSLGTGTETSPLLQHADTLSQISDTAIHTLRRIATELRPSVLDKLGLIEALQWQAEEFTRTTGIPCEVDAPSSDLPMNEETSTTFFRIFQEALTNVARHAEATLVQASLREAYGEIVMSVQDNGKGITTEEQHNKQSLGLLGMSERARIIGGSITIEGDTSSGTTVRLSLPAGNAAVKRENA